MTATITQLFPPLRTVIDALRWHQRHAYNVNSRTPPLDETGNPDIDSYLAAIFGRLCTMQSTASCVVLLASKIIAEYRHVELLDTLDDDRGLADIHRRTGKILQGWLSAIVDEGL